MSEVKVILSLETKQVAEQAAEAGKTMETMAQESAKVMRDEAAKTEEAVSDASEKSAKSVESVKEAAEEADAGIKKIGDAAQTASASLGSGMKQAAGSIKSAAGAASGVVSALGGVAPQLGFIGQALGLLVSGPIGWVTAAVTVCTAVVVKAWNAATASVEDYRKHLEIVLQLQTTMTDRIDESARSSRRYLDRLEELNRLETRGNAAKAEQAHLVALLISRYGELGLEIDATTGKVEGLDGAREKIRKADKAALEEGLLRELDVSERKLSSLRFSKETLEKLENGDELREIISRPTKKEFNLFETDPDVLRKQVDDLKQFLDQEYIPGEDIAKEIAAYIAALEERLRILDQYNSVRETGYRTEDEYTAALSDATSRQNVDFAQEQARIVAAAATGNTPETAGAATGNTPETAGAATGMLDSIKNAVTDIVDRYRMLKHEQELIADGKEREAVIEKETMALRRRAAQMGVELTQEQIDSMEEAIGSWYDYMQSIKPTEPEKIDRTAELEGIAGQIAALYRPDAPGMVTNSLVARGGSAAGIRMPDLERYQRATSESTARLVELTEEQKRLIAEGALI